MGERNFVVDWSSAWMSQERRAAMSERDDAWRWYHDDASAWIDKGIVWLSDEHATVPWTPEEADSFCKAWLEHRREARSDE